MGHTYDVLILFGFIPIIIWNAIIVYDSIYIYIIVSYSIYIYILYSILKFTIVSPNNILYYKVFPSLRLLTLGIPLRLVQQDETHPREPGSIDAPDPLTDWL